VVYNGTLAHTSSSWQGALDDREDPDSSVVVNLRRKDDPDEAERERLASTIFAPEEETATFSMGNLVPPRKPSTDDPVEDTTQADPFIDELRRQNADRAGHNGAQGDDDTLAYFERLSDQTPAEMADGQPIAPRARPTRGSADLPSELPHDKASKRHRIAFRRARGHHDADASRTRRGMLLIAPAVGVLIGASVIVAVLSSGASPKPARQAQAASVTEPLIQHRPWVARSLRPQAPRHRVKHRPRPKAPAPVRHRAAAVAAASTPAQQSSSGSPTEHPTYQPQPAATAAGDSGGSSSGGQRAGPSGTVSLIGAGTSPSG
jgi:hypothetical protein